MFNKMKSGRFCQTNLISDLLKNDIGQVKNVYVALGQTLSGRYLIVFFIYKTDKRALILSARYMTKNERR